MTLYRQLLLSTLVILAIALSAAGIVQFYKERSTLSQQVSGETDRHLLLLAEELKVHLERADPIALDAVIGDSLEQRWFQQVELLSAIERHMLKSSRPEVFGNVPRWFSPLSFQPLEKELRLSEAQGAPVVLKVWANVAGANQALWQQLLFLLFWGGVILAISAAVLVVLLNLLLKPLRELERQAKRIENHQFGQPVPVPAIGELKGFVAGFNRLSERLHELFKSQADEADDQRRRVYQDELTGLGNRAYFDGQMQRWLAEPGTGAVMLLGIPYLEQVSVEEGFQARDELLCALQDVLGAQIKQLPGAVLARISGKEFGVILPGLDAEQVTAMAVKILRNAEAAIVDPFGNSRKICRLGAVLREIEATPSQLFSQADLALQQATRDPAQPFQIHTPNQQQLVLGREGWKQLALQAMSHDWFYFQSQPVMSLKTHEAIYQELFVGIARDGARYAASQFMPFIEQFGLGARLDRYVMERVDALPLMESVPVMINLSDDSLGDSDYIQWFKAYLVARQHSPVYPVIEVSELSAVTRADTVDEIFTHCRSLGFECGIDRFGHYFDKLADIALLEPDYIKVDIADLVGGEEKVGFVRALSKVVQSQSISIFAVRVESQNQLDLLSGLPVSAYQGYIKPPSDL